MILWGYMIEGKFTCKVMFHMLTGECILAHILMPYSKLIDDVVGKNGDYLHISNEKRCINLRAMTFMEEVVDGS